ncbi:MAG: hypothetical protein JNM94_13825 [Phycisphaerae bacterium]|nr:hypothetical protein [Phycisphaerae bacterium]
MSQRISRSAWRLRAAASLLSLAPFGVAAATPPANDACVSATLFDGLELHDGVNTAQATVQPCEAMATCGDGSNEEFSVWYRVTAPADGFLNIGAASTYPMIITIFDGCALPTQFGCIQPDCLTSFPSEFGWSGAAYASLDEFLVSAGSTYLIKISSSTTYGGDLWIDACLHPFPTNDVAAHAKVINAIEYHDELDMVGASVDDCEIESGSDCIADWSSDAVWYRYTAPVDGLAVATTFGSEHDTVLSLYDAIPAPSGGGLCNGETAIACTGLPNENGTILLAPMQAGQTLWFRVDATWAWHEGPEDLLPETMRFDFGFVPTGAPSNDLCSTATVIDGTSFHPPLLPITGASTSANEPSETCETLNGGVNDSVFYRFTAPSNGTINVDTIGSDYDTVLSIYDGCGVMTLGGFLQPTLLACNNNVGGLLGDVSALSGIAIGDGDSVIIKVASNGPNGASGSLDFNFEFLASVPCPADIDHDGQVSASDISLLLGAWGTPGVGDLNGSGNVDSADLALLLGDWGACN